MKLNRTQIYSIAGFVLLGGILLSLRTKPTELLDREKARSLNLQSTDINILKIEAIPSLNDHTKSRIQILEAQLEEAKSEEKVNILIDLSSVWYDAGQGAISGHYAEEIALIKSDAQSWGIAGTTYGLCIKQATKEKEKSLCLEKALESLEKAMSIDPDEVSYQLNRAVILAENPPVDNPMKGIQQLLSLNKKLPKNVPVINNIARFALHDRAEQRLLGALDIDPNNVTTNCLLAQLYQAKGNIDKVSLYQAKCK